MRNFSTLLLRSTFLCSTPPRWFRLANGFMAVSFLVAGCEPAKDPVVEKAKSELIVADMNEPAVSIDEAIATSGTAEGDAGLAAPQDIVLKAKVGSGKGETFDPTTSAFLVSEIPEGEHANDASHDSSNCPFCRAREAKAPTVMVRLVNKSGAPYPTSADQLLGLSKGQHVIIKGKGQFDRELNFYTVEAIGIQILQ